jgi:apolipoprotein N-acyltransferase
MNLSRKTRILLAVASGVAFALSFPKFNLSLLAWIAIGMLVLASCGARPLESLLYGFLHGLVFIPISVPWIDSVMQTYGNIDPWTSAGILGLLAVRDGIIFSLFSFGVALAYRKSRELACVLAPFLWVSLEFLDARIPIFCFPWNLAGYAASVNIALVQMTTVTGIYGLSFVVAAYSSLAAYAAMARTRRAWTQVIVATAILIIIAAGGGYLVPAAPATHVAHLVQTNFPQSESYPSNWMQIHASELDELERISVLAAKKSPGVIIWPEVPAPFSLQDTAFKARATQIAADSGEDFLVGVVDWKMDAGKWDAANAAVLLDPAGQRTFTYDKIHLVPFGEYVPLRHLLSFAGRLTADISDFTPGTTYSVGKIPGGTFGVFICYEAVFAGEVREFAANGAQLLITISNDGWFGHSAARPQHLMMARVRAVESRRWLLRDTNNGYTASIDPYGRVVATLAPDVRGELDAPYDFRTNLTPYARFGDWFAWLCVIITLAIFGHSITGRRG